MKQVFPLYHWSPVARRKSILRYGLKPGCRARGADWRPPYVCFAKSPSWAWALSAQMTRELADWDLWMVWSDVALYHTRNCSRSKSRWGTEYRVYNRIPKRRIWHVGTKTRKARR